MMMTTGEEKQNVEVILEPLHIMTSVMISMKKTMRGMMIRLSRMLKMMMMMIV